MRSWACSRARRRSGGADAPPSRERPERVNEERVLVIDDDVTLRSQLRGLLERNGAQCVEAESGVDGLRELYQGRPDLVILDVTMPDLDGWATLERIRDLTDVPILMLTRLGAE